MRHLRVAGAQIPVSKNVDENVAAIGRAIDFAASEGADILLTPEGSLSGYTAEFDTARVAEALDQVVAEAKNAGVGLALGTCFIEPEDGECYNQIRFYGKCGPYLGFHSKTLTCGTHDDPPKGEINRYAVAPLRIFEIDGIRAGALVCNDLWANPICTPQPDTHLTQQLAKLGVRIIFHAVNCLKKGNASDQVVWNFHESNLRMRARAGRLWIVTVNQGSGELGPRSPSGVLGSDGEWAVLAPDRGEQFFACMVEID